MEFGWELMASELTNAEPRLNRGTLTSAKHVSRKSLSGRLSYMTLALLQALQTELSVAAPLLLADPLRYRFGSTTSQCFR